MRPLKLKMIFPDLDPNEYKIHFAKRAPDGTEPLDEYVADPKNLAVWKEWNTYGGGKDIFNRKYIFSLIKFYPEEDTWLFGGIWEVVSRKRVSRSMHPYEIKLVNRFTPFIGRLKISYTYKGRTTRINMLLDHLDSMLVKEILVEPYVETFPGYKEVDLPFSNLELMMKNQNKIWKEALSIKGIYLITDTKTGKRYVGKADGKGGIWKRWSHYIHNGHAGDVDLKALIEKKGLDYARRYYKFSLLETITGEDEEIIDSRESHWKRVMLSREDKFGHNKN